MNLQLDLLSDLLITPNFGGKGDFYRTVPELTVLVSVSPVMAIWQRFRLDLDLDPN